MLLNFCSLFLCIYNLIYLIYYYLTLNTFSLYSVLMISERSGRVDRAKRLKSGELRQGGSNPHCCFMPSGRTSCFRCQVTARQSLVLSCCLWRNDSEEKILTDFTKFFLHCYNTYWDSILITFIISSQCDFKFLTWHIVQKACNYYILAHYLTCLPRLFFSPQQRFPACGILSGGNSLLLRRGI